jgi:hypothetical protein
MDQKSGSLCPNLRCQNLADSRAYRQLHADLHSQRQALTETIQGRYRVLLNDARALAGRGMLAPEKLAKLTGRRRRVDRVVALAALVTVLRTAWPRIEGKTALTLTELAQADEQAMQLMVALAHQKKPLQDLAKVVELRQRAFTVFANAYTQVRRAIQFLCPDEKAVERIIPTLYPRKRAARKARSTTAGVGPVAETSIQPTAAPASNQPQTATTPIQIIVNPATIAGTAASEPMTTFDLTHFGVMNSSPARTVPQQLSNSDAPSKIAAKQGKSKRRQRPTKRARFLR